ncbi:hypothetical protein [Paenibacillus sp. BJ-4]|uniref:hypothetical protein n=1 Tax=Paenibacillus sp. BJ-4 TaxID=2878097 RepID=UPI001CF03775|nr:hypothetical protein [Paenibacillus sp. BJ-4]
MLSLSGASFEDNNYIANAEQSIFATQDHGKINENEVKYTPTNSPMDFLPINSVHHRGKGAFQYPFTLSPQNGKNLNIYVKNNGSSSVSQCKG